MKSYQLIVIGAGSGGLVAAEVAAKLGARVALVESSGVLGGECLHAGCVPSKALIHAARTAWTAGHSQHLGIKATPTVNFQAVKKHIASAIQQITNNHDNDLYYQNLGVDVYHDEATFKDSHTIQAGEHTLTAKRFIIATGSRPAVPDIPGLTDGPYLTNDSVFNIDALPTSLTVIGGGPIGCELGQAFAMLGSQVTILQSNARLLPRDEPVASEAVLRSLNAMGIRVVTDAKIESVTYDGTSDVSLRLREGILIKSEKLLVATGRTANVPRGLGDIGVTTTAQGITVTPRLKTTQRHIYAIGDCNGGLQFTHAAAEQAVIAVQNALFGSRKRFDPALIPWVTFTTPEIAHFGSLHNDLLALKKRYRTIDINYDDIDKSVTEATNGSVQIKYDGKHRILGATVVGTNAAELLAQIRTTNSLTTLASPVQAYPTYAIGIKQAASYTNLSRLLQSPFGAMARLYIKYRL